MLILASVSDKVQLITSDAVDVDVQASWADWNSSAATPGRQNTAITTATTTDIVDSPAASTQRNVKSLAIYNRGGSVVTVTVQFYDGTDAFRMFKATLAAGDALQYAEDRGFFVESSGSQTLAEVYEAGTSQTSSTIVLDSTRGGIIIRDAATPIAAPLLLVEASGGQDYLSVEPDAFAVYSTSTVILQADSGNVAVSMSASGVAVTGSLTVGGTAVVLVTRQVIAGTGLSGGGALSSDVTLNLANTAVVAGSYGNATSVSTFTVDAQGRLTAAATTAISGLAQSAITNLVTDLAGKVSTATQVIAGTGLSGGGALSGNVTLSLPNTGPGAATYGGGGDFIESVTLDAQGRVTALTTGTPGGGSIGGTIAVNQVAYGSGADTIAGSANLTWNGSTLTVTNNGLATKWLSLQDGTFGERVYISDGLLVFSAGQTTVYSVNGVYIGASGGAGSVYQHDNAGIYQANNAGAVCGTLARPWAAVCSLDYYVNGGAGLGSGSGVVSIGNATTTPTTDPSGGGVLYAEAGALKWRGSSGTVTTIANA